jgi:sugar (pentulose or hexulose) kinase
MKLRGRDEIPGWNETLYRRILKEQRLFLLPELRPGSGQFPSSRPRIVEDGKNYFFDTADSFSCSAAYEELIAALRISLVMQTLTALERAGIEKGQELYTEGGFRLDESYNRLLASALADNKAYLTNVAEATALGAAMTAKMALTGKALKGLAGDFEIDYQEVEKSDIPELFSYRKAWMEQAMKQ